MSEGFDSLLAFFDWATDNVRGIVSTDRESRGLTFRQPGVDRLIVVRFPEDAWATAVEHLGGRPDAQGRLLSADEHFGLIAMWLEEAVASDDNLPANIKLSDSYFVADD